MSISMAHYIVSRNCVWKLNDAAYKRVCSEIRTLGRIGDLNLYGEYLGRISSQSVEIRRVAVELGSPRIPASKGWSRS